MYLFSFHCHCHLIASQAAALSALALDFRCFAVRPSAAASPNAAAATAAFDDSQSAPAAGASTDILSFLPRALIDTVRVLATSDQHAAALAAAASSSSASSSTSPSSSAASAVSSFASLAALTDAKARRRCRATLQSVLAQVLNSYAGDDDDDDEEEGAEAGNPEGREVEADDEDAATDLGTPFARYSGAAAGTGAEGSGDNDDEDVGDDDATLRCVALCRPIVARHSTWLQHALEEAAEV